MYSLQDILNMARDISNNIIEWRRQIHMYPELGYQEYRTSELIAKKLEKWGYEIRKGIAKTGVVGVLRSKHEGNKTIALRADMDALPIDELNDKPYKSRIKGVMHACGHDAHVAMLLGAAKILAEIRDELKGNVKLIFQPAEEGGNGALKMIEEGVLEDPKVDLIYGIHVWSSLPSGIIALKKGPILAAVGEFKVTIKGKGGHGAYPHATIDPIVISSSIIQSFQSIVSRNVDPTESAVVSVGYIHAGNAFNIIPEQAELGGTYRYLNESVGNTIRKRLREIVQNTCKAYGAECKIIAEDKSPPLVNDPEAVDFAWKTIAEMLGDNKVIEAKPSMGGEDFAFYTRKVPGAFIILGTGNPEKGTDKPHHNPYFDVDEDVLYIGTAVHVALAYRYLSIK